MISVPPEIPNPPGDVEVSAGAKVNLTCDAKGDPTPTLTWMRENNKQIRIDKKKGKFALNYTSFSLILKH